MIIDGETYACEGCIRGHRTRNCQHSDRPLQHIKAKGRPVSQCNHCRSERKNRSAHVKCQCGKRASEGGSDCGCFSGGKCKCATKKSPKQAPTQLGDISENLSDLASPASTLNTASPAQLSTSGDFQWSDATTPASNFPSLDGLAQFDPDSWLNTPPLDAAAAFGGSVADHSSAIATLPTTGPETGFQSANYQQQVPMDMPDFANVNDWPALDDESAKQFLAMMDHPAGMELTGLDASAPNTAGGFNMDPTFGLDFSSLDQQQPSAQPVTEAANGANCDSKREGGCGPCCSSRIDNQDCLRCSRWRMWRDLAIVNVWRGSNANPTKAHLQIARPSTFSAFSLLHLTIATTATQRILPIINMAGAPLRIGFVPEHFSTPIHFAQKHYGLDAVLTPFPSGTGAMITALRAKEIDIGIGLTEGWIAGLGKEDLPGDGGYRLVGTYVDTPLCWAISTGAQRPEITSVESLRGGKIGVSRIGSGSYVMGFVLADQHGWLSPGGPPPFSDNVVLHTFASLRGAVNSGAADFFLWEHFTQKRYFDAGEIRRVGELYTPWSSWKIVASTDLPAGDARVQTLFEKLDRGVAHFNDNQEEAVRYICTNLDYTEADARAWLKTVKFPARTRGVKAETVESCVAILQKAGVLVPGKGMQPGAMVV